MCSGRNACRLLFPVIGISHDDGTSHMAIILSEEAGAPLQFLLPVVVQVRRVAMDPQFGGYIAVRAGEAAPQGVGQTIAGYCPAKGSSCSSLSKRSDDRSTTALSTTMLTRFLMMPSVARRCCNHGMWAHCTGNCTGCSWKAGARSWTMGICTRSARAVLLQRTLDDFGEELPVPCRSLPIAARLQSRLAQQSAPVSPASA